MSSLPHLFFLGRCDIYIQGPTESNEEEQSKNMVQDLCVRNDSKASETTTPLTREDQKSDSDLP